MADRSYPELYAARKWRVSASRVREGRKYRCVEISPHLCRDGRNVPLAYLETSCEVCGEPFIFAVPAWREPRKVKMQRRCEWDAKRRLQMLPQPAPKPAAPRKPRKIKPAEIPLDLFG